MLWNKTFRAAKEAAVSDHAAKNLQLNTHDWLKPVIQLECAESETKKNTPKNSTKVILTFEQMLTTKHRNAQPSSDHTKTKGCCFLLNLELL